MFTDTSQLSGGMPAPGRRGCGTRSVDLRRIDQLTTGDTQHPVEQRLSVRVGGIRGDGLCHAQRLQLDIAGYAFHRPAPAEHGGEELLDGPGTGAGLLAHEATLLGEGE